MKIILMVIDGFGIGELPDAKLYNDIGANTYASLSREISIPRLVSLGLNNIYGVDHTAIESPLGCYARMRELSVGKDTLTGHHELAGVITRSGQPTYPEGFPEDIIAKLEDAFGVKVIGNKVASGTAIINELGDDHCKSGSPIVYTSADSVLQIACHEDIVKLDELYRMCELARDIMTGEHAVGRIIARPFKGSDGEYYRTENRRDYGLKPISETMLDRLQKNGITTVGIGKINDIFCGQGISNNLGGHSNQEVANALIKAAATMDNALIFANLVETDMNFGHRRDTYGYQLCMENIDSYVAGVMDTMINDDVLIVTSDHGCDPGFSASTDHTREYVPLLIYGKMIKSNHDLGTIHGMDIVAHTILDLFNVMTTNKSIKEDIIDKERRSLLSVITSPIYKVLKNPRIKKVKEHSHKEDKLIQ